MRRSRGAVGALGAVLAVLLLGGCTPEGRYLHLDPREADIPPCPVSPEPIAVATLGTDDPPSCLPEGSTLVFPDGVELTTSEDGGSGSISDGRVDHGYVGVGVYGMVATRSPPDCDDPGDLAIWGRPAAVAKLQEAFGDDLGMC